ncbi:MAG: helix-turn-helix transcriptional regulator [Lachnospiraceae bacterium]|nr:helix-turn-helix transcriptional regulator [Lachnospiraceae bacterium]
MTQGELAEGICDTYTLARYESGALNPSEENFQKIMNKLGMSEETILFNLQTEDTNIAKVRNRLLWLFEKGDYQGAENEVKEIISKNQLPLMYVENRQFLYRIRLVAEQRCGKLSLDHYILSLEKLLKESFKDYDSQKFVNKYFYTENELLILNNIAIAYGEAGKFETACRIFSNCHPTDREGLLYGWL